MFKRNAIFIMLDYYPSSMQKILAMLQNFEVNKHDSLLIKGTWGESSSIFCSPIPSFIQLHSESLCMLFLMIERKFSQFPLLH